MAKAAAKAIISGRVQGVWYRASARSEAERLGLSGWVRNAPDGSVEAFLEGERDAIERMLAWCRQGPPLAAVERVEVTWTEPEGHGAFRVTH
ncbi:MAG: acylphosphatase [Deltaproteobacteria bacterium]|nr:acylphosphatase [Deltaproteobacteria bacterium]